MKRINFIFTLVLIIAISSSCSKLNPDDIASQNQSKSIEKEKLPVPVSEWDLKDVSYDFDIQFPNWSNLDYSIQNGGIEQLSNDLAAYFFDPQYENIKKEKTFRIEFDRDVIWVNRNYSSSSPEAPCKTQSTTVGNSDDFEEVMADIFGQKRDVTVEVDYGLFSATISWTFQDC